MGMQIGQEGVENWLIREATSQQESEATSGMEYLTATTIEALGPLRLLILILIEESLRAAGG